MSATFAFISALLMGWYIVRRQHKTRIAKLGDTPRTVPYWIPFGFDTLYEVIKYNNRNANLQLLLDHIARTGAYTFRVI